MSRHLIITSFSERGFAAYGKTFMDCYAKHGKVPCVVYFEGEALPEYLKGWEQPFRFVPLASVTKWTEYDKRLTFPIMRGLVDIDLFTMNFDAQQVRKVFMEEHASFAFGGKVFWLDADTFIFDDITPEWLDELLPDDKMCCYLGRAGGKIPYTESGFIGFNASHRLCADFMGTYTTFFQQGLNFTLPGWHDCYGFDQVRRAYPLDAFKDLGYGAGVQGTHVFVNSVLGSRMDHRKGGRKATGSRKSDLTKSRPEEYWQNALD